MDRIRYSPRPNLGDSVTALLRLLAKWRENGANKNADAGGMAIASGGRVVFVVVFLVGGGG
jgi:hypothetical protein